jgi:alkyl sulfatase BDS1-like metallo-beta-lactamase superfamily hydrolase
MDPDTGKSWEESLVDSYGPRQENMYALHETLGLFFNGREDLIAAKHEELLSLVAKGFTPEEIVNRMRLPKKVLKVLSHLN